MSIVLYGKPVAEAIKSDLTDRIRLLKGNMIFPRLAIIRSGEREDDLAYEKRVCRNCDSIGIGYTTIVLDRAVPHEALMSEIRRLNEDSSIHGILLFRPFPDQIDDSEVCRAVSPEKDIDCMNPENLQLLLMGSRRGFAPCTPEAVMETLDFYGYGVSGKNAVIVNRSLVVGKPLSLLMLAKDATVTICHSKTENLKDYTKNADIVVLATGKPMIFGEDYFTEKNIVIDVSINFVDGSMCGDADFNAVSEKVKAISPVPGGIGAVTSMVLLRHLIESAEMRNK